MSSRRRHEPVACWTPSATPSSSRPGWQQTSAKRVYHAQGGPMRPRCPKSLGFSWRTPSALRPPRSTFSTSSRGECGTSHLQAVSMGPRVRAAGSPHSIPSDCGAAPRSASWSAAAASADSTRSLTCLARGAMTALHDNMPGCASRKKTKVTARRPMLSLSCQLTRLARQQGSAAPTWNLGLYPAPASLFSSSPSTATLPFPGPPKGGRRWHGCYLRGLGPAAQQNTPVCGQHTRMEDSKSLVLWRFVGYLAAAVAADLLSPFSGDGVASRIAREQLRASMNLDPPRPLLIWGSSLVPCVSLQGGIAFISRCPQTGWWAVSWTVWHSSAVRPCRLCWARCGSARSVTWPMPAEKR